MPRPLAGILGDLDLALLAAEAAVQPGPALTCVPSEHRGVQAALPALEEASSAIRVER